MSLHQLTRHLVVEPDSAKSDKVLFMNLITRTRMLAGDEVWDVLESFEQPHLLLDDPLQARAAQACIIESTEVAPPKPKLIDMFDEVSAKVLKYRKEVPSDDLYERADQLAKACKPISKLLPSEYFIWQIPSRVFEILLDHFKTFMKLETIPENTCDLPSELIRQSVHRPPVIQSLEQQTCTLNTSWKRAKRIAERFPQGGKVLILGDDDLVSLALSRFPQFEIDVLEIDLKLVRLLKKEGKGKFQVKRRDLSGGLPADLKHQYDIVVSDPMYSAEGMEMFVACCAQALKQSPESRLFLSTHPPLLEAPDEFFEVVKGEGLTIVHQDDNFNRYPFPEDSRGVSADGLVILGYHPKLVKILTSIPYLYANLYECAPNV